MQNMPTETQANIAWPAMLHYAGQEELAYLADMAAWKKAGKMKWKETILEGIEKAPEAFMGLFKGENFGKMLVKIGPEQAV